MTRAAQAEETRPSSSGGKPAAAVRGRGSNAITNVRVGDLVGDVWVFLAPAVRFARGGLLIKKYKLVDTVLYHWYCIYFQVRGMVLEYYDRS